MKTKIIYEDEHILVCHKPAGLATQSGRVGQPDVESELKKYLSAQECRTTGHTKATARNVQPPYLGVVHRLDQPVEGLLVFAKTQKAAANLTKQLTQGSLNKQYYAVVCGKPAEESGELVDYLVKDGNVAKVVEAHTEGAKKAVLQYVVFDALKAGQSLSMVSRELRNAEAQQGTLKSVTGESAIGESEVAYVLDVHIDTGRFHQIRVQLSHAGLPLLSDSKYGTPQALELGRKLGFCNVALFAYKLEFVHPATGKKSVFEIQPDFLHEK